MKINVAIIILFFTHICFSQNKIKKEVLETYSTSLKFGKPIIGILESKLTHFYDINGNIITSIMETYSEWAFNPEPKITYKYNKNNKLIETNYFNIDGTLIKKIIFDYDFIGNNTEYNIYNSVGDLEMKWTFKYDDSNKITEEVRSDSEGIYRGIYSYNSNEKKIIKRYQNDLLYNQSEFNYDKNGNEIESKSFDSNNELNSKTTKKYDLKNNLIEQINYGDNIFKYTYNYSSYNKLNHWTLKTTYYNDKIENTIVRKIEYR
jgi:hypothetical protein